MYAWNLTAKTIMHEDECVRFFRDVGYTGPNFDNDLGYRTEEEYRAWEERDPLKFTGITITGSRNYSQR